MKKINYLIVAGLLMVSNVCTGGDEHPDPVFDKLMSGASDDVKEDYANLFDALVDNGLAEYPKDEPEKVIDCRK